jgi:ATP-dependent exoDNAse (exonuclease V) alpha subunit
MDSSGLLSEIESAYLAYANVAADKASLADLQRAFDQYQVLCSTRLGMLGTQEVNERIDKMLRRHCQAARGELLDRGLFHGQAILIEANYPALDIYNGDIGFVIEDANGRASFQFYRGEHIDPIVVPGHKLTGYSLAYALTVHKSQGSEYRDVAVIVAPYAAELVSRRLLYTGITRSMEGLSLYISSEQSRTVLGEAR